MSEKRTYGHVIVRMGIPMPHYPWKTYTADLTADELLEIVEKYGLEDCSERYQTSATFVRTDDGDFQKIS